MDHPGLWLLLCSIFACQLGVQSNTASRCAITMSQTKSLAFQVPTGDSTDGYNNYNITEYVFDELHCEFLSFIGKIERYSCRMGNIVNTLSLIMNDRDINLDIGRTICKTTTLPIIESQSSVTFFCEDTELVKPRPVTDVMNNWTVIKPVSFHQTGSRNLTQWHKMMATEGREFEWHLDGQSFKCRGRYSCYWRGCSSLFIIGREGPTSPEPTQENLSQLLQHILLASTGLTSLEITKCNISTLPDIICQFENLQRLAIVNNGIQNLPTCLHRLSKLKYLDVSYNALESIDQLDFGQLWHFFYLDLSHNNIHNIREDALLKLDTLVYLSLRNNSLRGINFHIPYRYLPQLDLSHNQLRYFSFPLSISRNTTGTGILNIRTLQLQHNELAYLNFRIPLKLKYLDLSNNHISHIQEHVFTTAISLKTLNLRNNKLKVFRPSWRFQTFLNEMDFLDLKYNHIENLDESVFTRTPKILDISHNNVKIIDLRILENAKNLETLRLDYNNITEIRDDILNGTTHLTILPNLNYLNVSHNKLRIVPLSLIFLNIHVIDFSYNEIEKCTWSNMPHEYILKNIDEKVITSCIEKYSHKKQPMRNLFLLEHNKIKSMKDVFGRTSLMVYRYASLLCHVHLPNNPFHCDCKMYPYLRAMHNFVSHTGENEADDSQNLMSKVRAREFFFWNHGDLYPCHTPNTMRSYSLLDKGILHQLTCSLLPHKESECEFLFKPSDQLLVVNCSNLNMENIPNFDRASSIAFNTSTVENHIPQGISTSIYLNGNNFSNVGPSPSDKLMIHDLVEMSIQGHINLLDLSHSNLTNTEILHVFKKLTNLTHLYLNDNKITTLSFEYHIHSQKPHSEVGPPFWEHLTELALHNNPWNCSCDALWMKTWLNHLIAQKILVRADEIKCATPEWNRGQVFYTVHDDHFCSDPKLTETREFFIQTGILSMFLVALVVIACTTNFFKMDTLARNPMRVLPSRDAIVNDQDVTGMKFDAFVSYCESDAEWVEQELIPNMEQHVPPFKICQHKRHFIPAMTSKWNEFNAIRHSRRTIIIMSNSYLEREHCQYEFDMAYSYWIEEKKNPRLVVIRYPDVDINNYNVTCFSYFKMFTYLAKDEHTLERLFEFMPQDSLELTVPETESADEAELFMPDEIPVIEEIQQRETDAVLEEELRQEDAKHKQMWQEAELEAAARTEAGEAILVEEIFLQKLKQNSKFLQTMTHEMEPPSVNTSVRRTSHH